MPVTAIIYPPLKDPVYVHINWLDGKASDKALRIILAEYNYKNEITHLIVMGNYVPSQLKLQDYRVSGFDQAGNFVARLLYDKSCMKLLDEHEAEALDGCRI